MNENTNQLPKGRAARNESIILSLFAIAAAKGDDHPTRAVMAKAVGVQEGSVFTYVIGLIRAGLLERHGDRGRFYYTVTATGFTTRKPKFLTDDPFQAHREPSIVMPKCLPKLDAHLAKLEREDAERLAQQDPWWSTTRAKRRIVYKERVGATRDISWDDDATEIIQVVARECNTTPRDLLGPMRNDALTQPRWLCMYFMRTKLELSYPQIGFRLRRDHTTIIYGVRKVQARIETDEAYAAGVEALQDKIKWRVAA